jgi:hypothetical protein
LPPFRPELDREPEALDLPPEPPLREEPRALGAGLLLPEELERALGAGLLLLEELERALGAEPPLREEPLAFGV